MVGKDASGARPHRGKSRFPNAIFVITPVPALVLVATSIFWVSAADAQDTTSRSRFAVGPRPASGSATTAQRSSTMAVVNGEQITRQALADECLRRYGVEVLESMVNKQIILQACQTSGVSISPQDVEDEINNVAGKFGLSVDRWLTLLATERDVDPQQYRNDIIWPTLALRRLASKEITITEEEFRKAFESEYGPKVEAKIIAVTDRKKAEQILQIARSKPNEFAQLAKQHSEDKATASVYGVIPPIRRHLGDPNLEQVAFGLKPGEISPIIQVANQYLILKCEKRIDQRFFTPQQLTEIKKALSERIREHKMRGESARLFQQLQSKAQIVNVHNDANQKQQHPGVAALVNGRQITLLQLSEECITRHGKDVLEGEINRKLLQQELRRRSKRVEEQDIGREVARAADAYNFLMPDGSPDVDAWLEHVTSNDATKMDDATKIDLYVRDAVWPSVALKKLVDSRVQVTDEDMQKGFKSNFGERVEVLAIVMSDHRQAQQVWGQARDNPTDLFFGKLANQHSIEPTSRANFGKVPPLKNYGGQPLLEEEAFKLKAGELSGIIAVGDKYVILRCLGRTKPIVTEFDVVKDELYKDIHEKKLRIAMAKEFDRLKETAQIDNFLTGTNQAGGRLGVPRASPAGYQEAVTPRAGSIKR